MQLLLVLATIGAALNLSLQILAGTRLRTARPLGIALYIAANVVLLATVAMVLAPERSAFALIFVPVLVADPAKQPTDAAGVGTDACRRPTVVASLGGRDTAGRCDPWPAKLRPLVA